MEKNVSNEKLDQLLKYIVKISEAGTNLKKCIHDSGISSFKIIYGLDVVTWRGTLTRVGSSPYLSNNSDAWKIVCCKFEDVIFLCELVTEAKLKCKENETELQKRQTYWGHKFEQYVTTENIDVSLIFKLLNHFQTNPSTNEPVSTFENYCGVFKFQAISPKRTRISIFLGAEMDGIDNKGDFIELKTQFERIGLGRYWGEKEMKWWLQVRF